MIESNTKYGKFYENDQHAPEAIMGMSVDNCYTELIQLRNQNKILTERIKHLELQNFNLSKDGFFKPKHHEPIRAIFDENPFNEERQ